MNMCQDDAIVTFDHLLLHTNSLSAPVSDYPILRVKTKLHRPMLIKAFTCGYFISWNFAIKIKKRTAAIENEDMLSNFFDTVLSPARCAYDYHVFTCIEQV